MQITFGKYKGFTTGQLAQSGRDGYEYLRWGAENLRNPTYRKAFSDALKASAALDDKSIYDVAYQTALADGASADEAEEYAEERVVIEAEEAERDRLLDAAKNALRADLAAMGCKPQAIATIMRERFDRNWAAEAKAGELDKLFSSKEKKAAFIDALEKYDAALSAAFKL